jgi:hypothetical protein
MLGSQGAQVGRVVLGDELTEELDDRILLELNGVVHRRALPPERNPAIINIIGLIQRED